jgi:hypothetical protein
MDTSSAQTALAHKSKCKTKENFCWIGNDNDNKLASKAKVRLSP